MPLTLKTGINKLAHPVFQAIMVLIIMLLANGIVKILIQGGMSFETRIPWTLNIAFIFLFAMYNVILGLVHSSRSGYWFISMVCFIGLCILGGIFSHWISGLKIDEAGSYRWLYFVFFIVYLLIMVIILAIKKIVHMAEQDDHRFDQINQNKN